MKRYAYFFPLILLFGQTLNAQTLPDFSAATFSNPLQIDNPFHPLPVGQIREYVAEETDPDTGAVDKERIVIQTLNETRVVNGVEARVVRDRVFNADDQIIEDTFDWFAQDDAGNVWYVGESVTDYHYDDAGNLTGTTNPGQWEAGVDGAVAGFIMPAVPTVGDVWYSEFYAGEAEDQFEVLGVGLDHSIAGFQNYSGDFTDVLKTFDSTALDPTSLENKFYVAGIGKIATQTLVDGQSIGGESLTSYVVPEPSGMCLAAFGMLIGMLNRTKRCC